MSKARDIASAAPAPSTVSATELGHLDGVTSAIQTQLDAKTAKSTLTTTGDIYYASAANTPARLGIGTASQILAVNSGATAPEWVAAPSSGGMTLISTTTLTGASVSLSSIPSTYKNLQLVIRAYRPSTADVHLRFRFNGDSASNRHYDILTNEVTNTAFNATSAQLTYNTDNNTSTGLTIANIYDYTNTSTWKFFNSSSIVVGNGNAAVQNISMRFGSYNQTSAVSSIDLFPNSGNFAAGTALLYGVS
jgi:hypothetical protein